MQRRRSSIYRVIAAVLATVVTVGAPATAAAAPPGRVASAAAVMSSGMCSSYSTGPSGAAGVYFIPAIAAGTNGGYEIAYQSWGSGNGCLTTVNQAGTITNLHLGMQTDTSAAIAAVPGGYQIAFQANTGYLWTTGVQGTRNLGFKMAAWSSPSIAAVPGGYQIAFQTSAGQLETTGHQGTHVLAPKMAGAASSPTIVAVSPGGYQIAFLDGSRNLWTTGTRGTKNFGVRTQGQPSIATVAGGGYEIAYTAAATPQPNAPDKPGTVHVVGTLGSRNLGWATFHESSITRSPTGYTVAFAANSGNLWITGTSGTQQTNLAMTGIAGIAALSNGAQIAFQGSKNGRVWTTGAAGTHSYGAPQSPFHL